MAGVVHIPWYATGFRGDKLEAALIAAGVTHELVTVPGVDHAFFNDTGARYDQAAASQIYQHVLSWFGTHLT